MGLYGLDELETGISDLLSHKKDLLAQIGSGPDIVMGLETMLAQLRDLPPGTGSPQRLAILADRRHDSLLRFQRRLLEVLLTDPDASPAQVQLIEGLLSYVPA